MFMEGIHYGVEIYNTQEFSQLRGTHHLQVYLNKTKRM